MRVGLRHKRRSRVAGAAGILAACGAVAVTGAADAQNAADFPVAVLDSNTFSPTPAKVPTGTKVVWDWSAANVAHNVNSTEGPAEDTAWVATNSGFKTKSDPDPSWSYTFTKPGVYKYVCNAHAGMAGQVEVTGDPVEPTPTASPTVTATATATATATPSATATPTATATPDDHTSTPPPGAVTASDASAPVVSRIRPSGKRGVVKVRLTLSETSTVTLRVKKGRKVVRTARLQVRAGARTVKVRSAKFKRGRYTVELQARDAAGNTTKLLTAKLRIKRK